MAGTPVRRPVMGAVSASVASQSGMTRDADHPPDQVVRQAVRCVPVLPDAIADAAEYASAAAAEPQQAFAVEHHRPDAALRMAIPLRHARMPVLPDPHQQPIVGLGQDVAVRILQQLQRVGMSAVADVTAWNRDHLERSGAGGQPGQPILAPGPERAVAAADRHLPGIGGQADPLIEHLDTPGLGTADGAAAAHQQRRAVGGHETRLRQGRRGAHGGGAEERHERVDPLRARGAMRAGMQGGAEHGPAQAHDDVVIAHHQAVDALDRDRPLRCDPGEATVGRGVEAAVDLDPDPAARVGLHVVDPLIGRQAARRGEADAVVAVEAAFGADQNEAGTVLGDRRHREVAQSLLVGIGLEPDLLRVRPRAGQPEPQQQGDPGQGQHEGVPPGSPGGSALDGGAHRRDVRRALPRRPMNGRRFGTGAARPLGAEASREPAPPVIAVTEVATGSSAWSASRCASSDQINTDLPNPIPDRPIRRRVW